MSHQLNFLSQIIFHFPEAAQKQGRNFPHPERTERTHRPGLEKDTVRPRSQLGETWKAWPKCFYFKIYHLQLSSKFVWPPFVAHFSPAGALCPTGVRLIVIDWNYIFCPLPLQTPPASFPAPRNFKYSNDTHTQEVINSKSFLRDFFVCRKRGPCAGVGLIFFGKFSSQTSFGDENKGNFFHLP